MTSLVARGLTAWMLRPLVAALDAWSRRIARARAEERRRMAAARAAAKAAQAPQPTAQWPVTWNE